MAKRKSSGGGPSGPLNPQALSPEDVARVLTASGPTKPVTVEMIQADIDDGAPVNADGTINLVHFAAWLARQESAAESAGQ